VGTLDKTFALKEHDGVTFQVFLEKFFFDRRYAAGPSQQTVDGEVLHHTSDPLLIEVFAHSLNGIEGFAHGLRRNGSGVDKSPANVGSRALNDTHGTFEFSCLNSRMNTGRATANHYEIIGMLPGTG
jgi:hypothetical protein